jgi:DNA helicase II / ATP-dependent DNA helicase PcrA
MEKFNEAQMRAVRQTDGPMLVIAGAGTGKTRVITGRILHLLLEKNVPSSHVLALTFTEKATEEMISRIDSAMPLSYEELTIRTFHGFCDMVLREKGHEIGIDPGYKLLDQTAQWIFVKKHLFEMELDYYRPLGNPNKFIFVLLDHFSRLKDEDIAPESYGNLAAKKLEAAADEAEKEKAVKMAEVARAYRSYQELMMRENQMDFGDLLYYALRLFEKRPSVLKEYQERFKYILVDEFQDTNFAQNKLVTLLAGVHRNLTVVGDDDQSIYKWRGASLSNIMGFRKNFPDAAAVLLTSNYRSSQNILDAGYSLIQNNNPFRLEAREKIDKRLRSEKSVGDAAGVTGLAGGVPNGAGEPVEIRHFSSYRDEARAVASDIGEIARTNGSGFGDFAILVRANQHSGAYVEALKEAGIPFSVRDTGGLMRYEEIKDLVALLRFLVKPGDDIAFFRLLCLPVFGIPVGRILELSSAAREADYSPLFYYLRDLVEKKGAQTELPGLSAEDETSAAIAGTYGLFNSLLDFTRGHTVARVIGEFLDKSGYYKSLTGNLESENADKILHITAFMELAADFESAGNEGLHSFRDYLKVLEEAQGALTVKESPDHDSVSILTVHSAKGLEFEYVFIPCLVANRFPATRRSDPIEIPPELIGEELPQENLHLHEERRLFYVACTRAKTKLFLSYSDFYEGPKKWKPSVFLSEIGREEGKVVEKDFSAKDSGSASSPDDKTGRSHAGLKKTPDPDHGKKLLYVPAIDVNRLSYSKVDTFQTCPLKYKFRYLFEIPSPSAHAANFGSSVHNTVNAFYTALKDGAKPDPELLKKCYEDSWIGAGYESLAHEQTRKKRGWEIMEGFYREEEKLGFLQPAHLEKPFSLKIGGMRFSGRIDRIDKLPDGTFEVIDFKTGTYKKDTNLKKDLQLSLYAMACRDVFKLPVSALSLYFLEDGRKVSTTRSDKDLEVLKTELTAAYEEMKASSYLPTPGHHCQWCEYRVLCNAAA